MLLDMLSPIACTAYPFIDQTGASGMRSRSVCPPGGKYKLGSNTAGCVGARWCCSACSAGRARVALFFRQGFGYALRINRALEGMSDTGNGQMRGG